MVYDIESMDGWLDQFCELEETNFSDSYSFYRE